MTLKDAVDRACAVRQYSRRTFEAYWHRIKLSIQELLGHADVETSMIYTHVLGSHAGRGVVSPLDRLGG